MVIVMAMAIVEWTSKQGSMSLSSAKKVRR